MSNRKNITKNELINLIKKNTRKNENEEGILDYDVFVGFDDGTYEGIEIDTSYHILVDNDFLYLEKIKEFLKNNYNEDITRIKEAALWLISDYFSDGNTYELEDVDRVFEEFIVEGDNFIVVKDHYELFQTMVEYPGRSIVVEWSR